VPVPDVTGTKDAYKSLFGTRTMHEAVRGFICRAAALMNKQCGDKEARGKQQTTEKATALL